MSAIIRVLALDAAFANCGMAVAEIDVSSAEAPVIRPLHLKLVSTEADKKNKKVVRKNSDDLRRTREIASAIRDTVVSEKIDLVMVEVPTGAQSARAAWSLGIVVGYLGSIQAPLIEVTPKEVKIAVGDKYAEKEEIIDWAMKNYPALNWPMKGPLLNRTPIAGQCEHLADACAVLSAGVVTEEFKRLAIFWRNHARAAA
jgi:hypothetical protein